MGRKKTYEGEKPKRKQKPKPGKVVRLSPEAWKIVLRNKKDSETIVSAIDRMLGLITKLGKSYFILPETKAVFHSRSEAMGFSILNSVKKKKTVEKPIEVKEIL